MRYLIFIIYTLFIVLISVLAYLNIIPTKQIRIPYYDYVGHFVLYGIWSFVITYAFPKALSKKVTIPWGIMAIILVTVVEEYLQSFSPVRTFSLTDLGCSLSGIICGYLLYKRKLRAMSV